MNFYFYTNKNLLFDFLGRNVIAPDTIVKDIKRYRTIATASDLFLFVTHKKLNRKSREYGIGEPEFVYPVTLELTAVTDADGKAILVSQSETGYEYSLEFLSTYSPEKHIGAYLISEIPFSCVQKIYFDTQDDMDMFSRPSPDYWYPTTKYALLPDDFNEELCFELEEKKITSVSGMSAEEVIFGYRKREKKRAGILNFVNGTNKWQLDKYVFNIDGCMQELLGLSDEMIAAVLPHYDEVRDKGNVEYLSLVHGEKSIEFNQFVFDKIASVLISYPYNTQKMPEQIVELLNLIACEISEQCKTPQEKALINNTIIDIEKMILDNSDKGPEEISASIPGAVDVLRALMFVVKNPNRYEMFLESLEAYHADMITKRRALVLWGYLNGLYGMPGEGFNKDNMSLWQFIEWMVQADEEISLAVAKPEVTLKKNMILGITLNEKRIVTASEIREMILAMPKERIKDAFYKKLLEAAENEYGTKKKAENKGYAYCIASISIPEIKIGDELTPTIRKQLEVLLKDCKAKVPNKDSLFRDYVEDKAKFEYVFSNDPAYWTKSFKAVVEKKDEKI